LGTLAALVAGLLASPASAAQPAQRAGVQAHLLWSDVDTQEMDRQLDLLKDAGAAIVRVDVGWASLQEEGPDRWNAWHLGRLDHVVAAAHARGLQLLLTFWETPCWASTAPESARQSCAGSWWDRDVMRYPPADADDYAHALAQLAARYRGRVAGWEIWNEPNDTWFWKSSDPARDYARLVKAAYGPVKAADPGTTIVAGSLSQSDHAFTDRLYDLGIKGAFDAFSIHPYTDDRSPANTDVGDPRWSFAAGVPAVHAVMLAHGDRSPLWLTESGWSTTTTRDAAPWDNGVSEDRQASFLLEQARLVKQLPYVDVNIWFNLLDRGGDRGSRVDNYGLRRVDGTAKPAWAAFRQAAALLQAGPALGGDPAADTTDGAAVAADPAADTTDGPSGGAPAAATSQPAPGPAQPAEVVPVTPPSAAPAESHRADRVQRAVRRARHLARALRRAEHDARVARRHGSSARRRRAAARLRIARHRALAAKRLARAAMLHSAAEGSATIRA
jgi:hypothetical protein